MINSAKAYPLYEILSTESKIKYVVPKYQREYVWSIQHWEALFNDIAENEEGHFLGSIICINKNNVDTLQIQNLEVVDGQQRLTTLSILYVAVYNWFKKNVSSPDEEIKNNLYNLRLRLIQKFDKKELKLEPSHQRHNYNDYLKILSEADLIPIPNGIEIPNYGNRRLYKAIRFFEKKLNQKSKNGDTLFGVREISEFLEKINAAIIVKIEVASHSDAFTLFESLNNRGIPLSAIDLIKNNMLSVLEKKENINTDESFEMWNKVQENLSEDYSLQERYLRHYYHAFKVEDKVNLEKISRATRSNLIKIYDKLIEKDVKFIYEDLAQKSEIYKKFINPIYFEDDQEMVSAVNDLNRIGAAPSFALLLYLFASERYQNVELCKIINLFVKYFVRRNLTDFPPTRDLDQIFINLILKIHSDKPENLYQYILSFIMDKANYASQDMFNEKLLSKVYDENYGATRFILCKVEEYFSKTKEIFADFWIQDKRGQYLWTVEHIFPQGDNIPESWTNMIAKGDKKLAENLRDEYVHTFGNLTLTAYNPDLGNLSFIEKRDRIDKNGKFIGYKNGLFLNADLRIKDEWTIEDIKDRSKKIIESCQIIFKIST